MTEQTPADIITRLLEEAAPVPELAWRDLAGGKAWTRTYVTPEGEIKIEQIDPYIRGPAPD